MSLPYFEHRMVKALSALQVALAKEISCMASLRDAVERASPDATRLRAELTRASVEMSTAFKAWQDVMAGER